MYQGKNPTALQSQNLITEALLALMEEEPFQKITIKAVCAHSRRFTPDVLLAV